MERTLAEKFFMAPEGTVTDVRPDICMINDDSSHIVADMIQEKVHGSVKDYVVVVLDHDIPAGSFNSAFIQKKLINFSRDNDLDFIQSEGIGYHIIANGRVKPGDVLISCGNHGCLTGAGGALGLKVTPEQMASYLKGEPLMMKVPEQMTIILKGHLEPGTDMYDVALSYVNVKNSTLYQEKLLVFADETDCGLSENEKRIVCLMALRAGAVSAVFNIRSDDLNDANSQYKEYETWQLGNYVPMVAEPGDICHAIQLTACDGIKVDACFIGGCAGGHIENLRKAAAILKNRRIKRELRLLIGFAANDDYLQAVEEGLIDIFFDCGAQVTNPGCASCKTTSIGVVGDGEVLLSTGCYNYAGCSGTEKSKIYIASVETVAKAAINGYVSIESERIYGK